MIFITIAHHYLVWHYTQGLQELLHVYRNFIWFITRLFSLPELVASLFSPFRRIVEARHQRWSFEDLAGRLLINLLSRLIGTTIRLTLLLIGGLTLAGITTIAGILVVTWFVAPALITVGLIYGAILTARI